MAENCANFKEQEGEEGQKNSFSSQQMNNAHTNHGSWDVERTIESVLRLHFRHDKTKVNADALSLVTELIRVFAAEAAERAAVQAKKHGSEVVSVEHVEQILPQLLLDV